MFSETGTQLAQQAIGAATLEGEVHGALMLIWVLAKEKGGELRVPFADIVRSSGRVTRVLDEETKEMVFTALDEPDDAATDTPAEGP